MTRPTWLSLLSEAPMQRRGLRALQICVGIQMLFRVLTELPAASYLWGPHGITHLRQPARASVTGIAGKLIFSTEAGTKGILLAIGALAVLLLIGRATRFAVFGLSLLVLVLEARLNELGDGGDNVTRLVLIYMCFMLGARARWRPGSLLVWLHNLAAVTIIGQLLLLYTTSGMMKVRGDSWYHGFATYVISGVEWFSLPSSRPLFHTAWGTALTSYVPMFYQVMFPVAVLAKRLRLPWILIGGVFHLGVAVTMGLITFTTAMIGLELFFLTDADFERLGRAWQAGIDLVSSWAKPGRAGRVADG